MPHTHHRQHFASLPSVLMVLVISLLLSSLAPAQAQLLAQAAQPRTATSTDAQEDKDVRLLEPGTPIERELAGGEVHSYRIMLKAGEYLHVAVDQRGINVVVVLRGSDGVQSTEMDGPEGMLGTEELSWEAASAGEYVLEVQARTKQTNNGHYEVRVEKATAASARARALIAAERLYMEGRRGGVEGSGAGLERAVKAYREAVEKWREAGARKWEAETLNNLGIVYRNLSQYEKAKDYFEQALAISREIKNRKGEGGTLGNLGNVHRNLGRYEKARDYFEQALLVFREIKDRQGEGATFNNLGNVYQNLGQYEKARDYFEQALLVFREIKNRNGEGATFNNLGIIYHYLSQYEKARDFYEQALLVFREIKNRQGEGGTLSNLGAVYNYLSQYEKGRDYYEQALVIMREIKNRRGEGTSIDGLGDVHRNLSQYEKARDYFEQALAISREIKDRKGEGATFNNLGNVYRNLSQYEKARESYEQALVIRREIKDRGGEGLTLSNTMSLWKFLDKPRLAIFYGKQAVNAYQDIRSNIQGLEKESQRSFLKSKENTYRELADLLISLGRLPEAQQVLGLLKEEEYFDFIRRNSDDASALSKRAALTAEEAEWERRYQQIADQVASIGRERGDLLAKKARTAPEEQTLAKLETNLEVANQHFQRFLDQLSEEFGSSKEANFRVTALKETQGLMDDLRELGAGAVALYTVVGEERYRVILVTPDAQLAREYPIKAADLNRKVLQFREALQDPMSDPRPLAQELYRILVGPVAKDLKQAHAKTLMWSLDGVLRYVPIAALHDGQKYMVESYRNVVFTIASNSRLKDLPSQRWRGLGLGVTKAHTGFSALPAVPDELRGIIREQASGGKAGGVLPGKVMLDEAFTEETMKAELRQRYPVVHVASHFLMLPGNESDSFLLLGDGRRFTLAEIKRAANLFGGVELLTLSACDTATGGAQADGKEVEGFGVLAQRQGAKAVVASLWPVVDVSTRLLMQKFYRARSAQAGMLKAEAMRQAQVALLRGGEKGTAAGEKRYAHPYFWAPFILIGNWR